HSSVLRHDFAACIGGVVEQHVDMSVYISGVCNGVFDAALFVKVKMERKAYATCGAHLLGRALGAIDIDIGEDDLAAFACKPLRGRRSDAAIAAADDGDLALHSLHETSSGFSCSGWQRTADAPVIASQIII